MNTTITTILLTAVLLTAGAAMGEIDVTLETYDRNNDGVIDEVERVTLDIDIENSRIRVSESMFEGGYTTTGSLILTDEFRNFAFAGTQGIAPVPVADPDPTTEPKVTVIQPPPPEQTPVPPPTTEEDEPGYGATPPPNTSTAIVVGMGAVGLLAAAAILYNRSNKDKDDPNTPE